MFSLDPFYPFLRDQLATLSGGWLGTDMENGDEDGLFLYDRLRELTAYCGGR
jgi:hypothetical protein